VADGAASPVLRVTPIGPGGCLAPPGTPGAPPRLPSPWRSAAAALADATRAAADVGASPPVIMVVGPRGSGKSTLARLVANEVGSSGGGAPSSPSTPALLPCPVLWVDGDAGQPEFTPPGLISAHLLRSGGGGAGSGGGGLPILGPPHTHPRPGPPAAAAFLGSPNPGADPGRYASGADLVGRWGRSPEAAVAAGSGGGLGSHTTPALPAIINTHGWARGVGADLTATLACAAAPTHVLVLASSSHPARNTPPVPWWPVSEGGGGGGGRGDHPPPPLVATLEAAGEGVAGSLALSPSDARALAWLAWARACCAESAAVVAAFSPVAAALAATTPFLLRLGGGGASPSPRPRLVWVGGGGTPPPARELQALNAGVVGVGVEECGEEEGGSDSSSEGEGEDGGGGGVPALPPFLGLALVRAADAGSASTPPALYLLMPPAVAGALRAALAGPDRRRRRLVLQAGGCEVPPALLHWSEAKGGDGGPSAGASPYLAPWCLAGVGTGARVQASRNDLARAGQQK